MMNKYQILLQTISYACTICTSIQLFTLEAHAALKLLVQLLVTAALFGAFLYYRNRPPTA